MYEGGRKEMEAEDGEGDGAEIRRVFGPPEPVPFDGHDSQDEVY